MLVRLNDPDDVRLRPYVGLRDAQLRQPSLEQQARFIAEGALIIDRAVAAGYQPESLLLAEKWLPDLAPILERFPEMPVFIMGTAEIERVTGFHVHRGALGCFLRRPEANPTDIERLNRIVVVEDIVDHTNVGAILRCTAGLGWDGVLLAPRSADPLYRRSIKVAMGAVFTLPWARLTKHAGAIAELNDAGFETVAMALGPNSRSLADAADELRGVPKLALVLGTEGSGLSDRWLSEATHQVQIPMFAGIDSLNVAAAAAVACWELRR